ncbi:hypothetical protein [Actinophytocola sp.]|uniref:hypothetical protein n=1 Tax=Actinophytocola sp. TaxID=1872138 RepID=UPI0025C4761C|nr:hypothetical protein [Actinophytocola sp.]
MVVAPIDPERPGEITVQLEWINTYLPLVVPKMLATDAFFIFLRPGSVGRCR